MAKFVVFGRIGCIRERGCIWAKYVVFGQNWLYSIKLVVFGQNCLLSGKLVLFG